VAGAAAMKGMRAEKLSGEQPLRVARHWWGGRYADSKMIIRHWRTSTNGKLTHLQQHWEHLSKEDATGYRFYWCLVQNVYWWWSIDLPGGTGRLSRRESNHDYVLLWHFDRGEWPAAAKLSSSAPRVTPPCSASLLALLGGRIGNETRWKRRNTMWVDDGRRQRWGEETIEGTSAQNVTRCYI
jgi:hypothetical protein